MVKVGKRKNSVDHLDITLGEMFFSDWGDVLCEKITELTFAHFCSLLLTFAHFCYLLLSFAILYYLLLPFGCLLLSFGSLFKF